MKTFLIVFCVLSVFIKVFALIKVTGTTDEIDEKALELLKKQKENENTEK